MIESVKKCGFLNCYYKKNKWMFNFIDNNTKKKKTKNKKYEIVIEFEKKMKEFSCYKSYNNII